MSKFSGCQEDLAMWKEKPTVRYHSEFVEKEREIKNPIFRQFIYVNLRIAVEVCKNLLFTPKYA